MGNGRTNGAGAKQNRPPVSSRSDGNDRPRQLALGALGRLEALDLVGLHRSLHSDVICAISGRPNCFGTQATVQRLAELVGPASAIYHDIRDIVSLGQFVFIEMDMIAWWQDRSPTTQALCMTFRMQENRVREWRIHGWRNPLINASTREGEVSVFDRSPGLREQACDPMGHYFTTPEGLAQVAAGARPIWALPGFSWHKGPGFAEPTAHGILDASGVRT